METSKRSVLLKILAKDGEWVKKGQPIFRLNRDSKAVALRQARDDFASLGKQVVTLADDPGRRQALSKDLQQMLNQVGLLPTGQDLEVLKAPEKGLLHIVTEATQTLGLSPDLGVVVQGSLAQVVSDRVLQVEATLGELNRTRVVVGQPVRLRIIVDEENESKTTGTVTAKPAADKVVIEARVTDAVLGQRLAERIAKPTGNAEPPKAEIRVVVGNVRLVKFLFAKKAPAKTAQEKGKEKGLIATIKRLWKSIFH
jgi:multidrug efflux pump subunit AcrA (membrane-fusion protein)